MRSTWVAALAALLACSVGSVGPVAGYEGSGPAAINPGSATPVRTLPFQSSVQYQADELLPATDPANAAVAEACNDGSPLYLSQWFAYHATEDVALIVRSSAVPAGPAAPAVSPVALVAGDGATVISCGVTHAFDRQQIGPAFLSAGESVFLVRFAPTVDVAEAFVRDGYTVHTRVQATTADILNEEPRNDSWWLPHEVSPDEPTQLAMDVGPASVGSVEVDLAGATPCWGATTPARDPLVQPAVWFSYTARTSGPVAVSAAGSDYPVAILVATGSVDGPTAPGCRAGRVGEHTFTGTAGTRYLIGAYGYDHDNVNVAGRLRLSIQPPSVPVALGDTTPVTAPPAAAPASGPAGGSGGPAAAAPVAAPLPAARVRVTSRRSALVVDVNPNRGRGFWRVQVQRLRADGSWRTIGTYRTKGAKETRRVALGRGTYRVRVMAKHGYQGTLSAPVRVAG